MSSINNRLALDQQVPHERLRRQFEKWWCELKEKLDSVFGNSEVESIAGLKWLFLREDMAAIQARVNCKAVWIIVSNLYETSLDPAVKDLVQENMKREIVYTYIIPDSPKNADFVQALEQMSAANCNYLKISRIAQSEFDSVAAADYTIVNPDCGDSYPLQMFLELPIRPEDRYPEDKYWIEVEPQAALKFVTRFRPLAKLASIQPQQSGDS